MAYYPAMNTPLSHLADSTPRRGSLACVGMGMTPPTYLKAGDRVRVEIQGIGAIENKFV